MRTRPLAPAAFTLIELLIVVGVILVINVTVVQLFQLSLHGRETRPGMLLSI